MTPEMQLVSAMRAGDERAFDEFFRDYSPRLYRFVLQRLRNDPSAAEDVCQVVLGRAMRRIDSWRGEAALFTWLCQIARNELTDYWRRQQRRDRVEVFAEDDAEIAGALDSIESSQHSQPERESLRDDVGRLVQVALDRLPVNYGNALEWKYIEGHSTEEIARRQGVTTTAAQSLLARARAAFRDAFDSLTGGRSADVLPFVPKGGSHD